MENLFDSLSLPPTSIPTATSTTPVGPSPTSNIKNTQKLTQAQKQMALQQYVLLQSQQQRQNPINHRLSPSSSSQSIMSHSPNMRPQRPPAPMQGQFHQQSQSHSNSVINLQRMAQHYIGQIQKSDDALKNPNLDVNERNTIITYKTKYEHELLMLRNSAAGNTLNNLNNNSISQSQISNHSNNINISRNIKGLQNNTLQNINRNTGQSPAIPNAKLSATNNRSTPPATYNLPAGPPLFPPCPQLTSKIFENSLCTESNLHSPLKSSQRLEKRPRDIDFLEKNHDRNPKVGPKKLSQLMKRINPTSVLDNETETKLLEMADEFLDHLTNRACQVAKIRNSESLQIKDFQLELERTFNLHIPGYSEQFIGHKKPSTLPIHVSRLALVTKAKKEEAALERLKTSLIIQEKNITPPSATSQSRSPFQDSF